MVSTLEASSWAVGSGPSGAALGPSAMSLRTSTATLASPEAAAATASWHIDPTIAAVELLSAPPESGRR